MEQANIRTGELFTLQLPSEMESLTSLENLIEELADKYQIGEDTFANMMTCLNEAFVNAIVHGNKLDANKKVIINADVDKRRIVWTITDEGTGFDFNNLPDPTAPENLENLTGRGVYIVKQLADQCVFNKAGNEIELHFKI
ncbi:ATP-binding protein [Mucilaginibacter paludis]|uniref:Anti-sigma regulatory factor, serine/threonine protein kinase n=1 Tax=Mucilaginibacter paludis DSM 18603 TaxID=714943 RepID=H1YIR9_9SPHI|nr:ATP-binding protein [Mucilaginibacter paludis]EHQ27614.1 putative anti-sigma regulatory factor, serine/threonine protein kinase [Mucilaginibacter paludis DSM 18603]